MRIFKNARSRVGPAILFPFSFAVSSAGLLLGNFKVSKILFLINAGVITWVAVQESRKVI